MKPKACPYVLPSSVTFAVSLHGWEPYQYHPWKPIPLALRPVRICSRWQLIRLTTNVARSRYSSGAVVGYGGIGTYPLPRLFRYLGDTCHPSHVPASDANTKTHIQEYKYLRVQEYNQIIAQTFFFCQGSRVQEYKNTCYNEVIACHYTRYTWKKRKTVNAKKRKSIDCTGGILYCNRSHQALEHAYHDISSLCKNGQNQKESSLWAQR